MLTSSARVQRGPSEAARCASTGDHLVPPLVPLPGSITLPLGTTPMLGSTAAVERGPSEGARSGSKEQTWVPFLIFLLPPAANSVQRAGRSRSRIGGNGLCVGDSAWR
jgi:hypothetical protein